MTASGSGIISKLRYVLAGGVILLTAFVVGTSADLMNSRLMNELSSFTDSFDSVLISDEQVPLADQEVKTASKTTTKTVKLKSKAKKTYTKKLADRISSRTVVTEEGENLIVRNISTKTATTEKYTKKKKTKKVIVRITPTTITTTYPIEGSANEEVSKSSKTTSKTVKLKTKAKKTYSKKLPDKVSTKTVVKSDGNSLVQTDTITETKTVEKYTKKKKTKRVVATVTTTVITSKYAMKHTEPESATGAQKPAEDTSARQPAGVEPAQAEETTGTEAEAPVTGEANDAGAETGEAAGEEGTDTAGPGTESSSSEVSAPAQQAPPAETGDATQPEEAADEPSNDTAPALPEGTSAIRTAAPKADNALLEAFDELGFTFKVDASYQYTGVFDARTRVIILRYNDDNVYHELGHFLAFVAGNYDVSSAFKDVYNREKSLYTGRNQAYILKNSSEYFAESYRDYVLNKSELKSQRPLTYGAIETVLGRVTDIQIDKIRNYYSGIWE